MSCKIESDRCSLGAYMDDEAAHSDESWAYESDASSNSTKATYNTLEQIFTTHVQPDPLSDAQLIWHAYHAMSWNAAEACMHIQRGQDFSDHHRRDSRGSSKRHKGVEATSSLPKCDQGGLVSGSFVSVD